MTEVEPGVSWTWCQRSPGATTLASHEVVPHGTERTLVRQRIDQRGPVGVVVGVLMRRLTKRYLDLEARGLKARQRRRSGVELAARPWQRSVPTESDPMNPNQSSVERVVT